MFIHSIRRFIIAVLAFTMFSYSSFSQGCVIDTNNFELLSPASEYLPCIERNVPYEATIQIFAIPSVGFPVDSYLITTFLNLPSGITYSINPMPCKLYPADHACVYLSGTTTDSVGNYLVDYNGFIYLQQGTPSFDYVRSIQPGVLPEVSLKVIEQGASCPNTSTGIEDIASNKEIDFIVYPNPSSGIFNVKVSNGPYRNAEINVLDVTGRTVYSTTAGDVSGNRISIDLNTYAKGLYTVRVRSSEGVASKNVVVE